MYIKMNDLVEVIAGKDRGKTGKVKRVDNRRNRVFVEGVNIVTRHQKPVQGREGGLIQKEASIDVSNVRLYSEEHGRGFRVAMRFVGSDDQLYTGANEALATYTPAPVRLPKVRVFVKAGQVMGRVDGSK